MGSTRKERRIIVVSATPLTEEQLEKAFVVEDDNTFWRAMLQVIEDMATEATEGAEVAVGNPYVSASCNGGAEHLKRLRLRMFDLRERGIRRHTEEDFKPSP